MLNKRFKLNYLTLLGLVLLFVFAALIPNQARAANMSYDGWEIDGFFRNNTGVWTENWDYAPNNDPLATFRNWFRLNLNGKISETLRLKAEVLAVYESEYSREHHATEAGLDPIAANEYNQFDFREMRLDWRPAMGHNIRIGKQIVNWGESISARVGDVINPQDMRFDLGFTNLEDSRMPIWMIRGLHQFYDIGTSIDWIFSPYLQTGRYRASRTLAAPFGLLWTDGSIDPLLAANGFPTEGGQRFAPQPEYRLFLEDGQRVSHNQVFTINPGFNAADPTTYWLTGGPVLYNPQNSLYENITAADIAAGGGMALTSAGLPAFTPGYYLADLASALGAYNPPDIVYPDSSLKDARYGFKTSSTIFGAQTGVYFFRRHRLTPCVEKHGVDLNGDGVLDGFSFMTSYDYDIKIYGFYANKNFDFGVLRMDMAYTPDYPLNTNNFSEYPTGVAEKDRLQLQLGFNKDFMFRPINEFQTINLIAEYVGQYYLEDDMDNTTLSFITYTPVHKDEHTLMLSMETNYNFGMYKPGLTVICSNRWAGLVQPSFTYNPDWMNRKWTFKLQYNMVFGDKIETGTGLLEEKDLVILTTQFSFP